MIEHLEVFPAKVTTETRDLTPARRPHGVRIIAGNGQNVGRVGNELYSTRSNATRAARKEAKVRGCAVTLVDARGAFVKYL